MRFLVKKGSCGETHVVPYGDAAAPVKKLKSAIVERLCAGEDSEDYKLCLAGSGAVISEKDTVQEVLQDGDCLSLTCE